MLFLRASIFQKRSPKLPKVTIVIAMITTKSNTRQDIGGKSLRYCLVTVLRQETKKMKTMGERRDETKTNCV